MRDATPRYDRHQWDGLVSGFARRVARRWQSKSADFYQLEKWQRSPLGARGHCPARIRANVLIGQPKATDTDGMATAIIRCVTAGQAVLNACISDQGAQFPLAGTALLHCVDAVDVASDGNVEVVITPLHATAAADANTLISLTCGYHQW
jgi:hypothetical protein